MTYHEQIDAQVRAAYGETARACAELDALRLEIISHLNSRLGDHEKLFHIYDAMCRTTERIELAKMSVTTAQAFVTVKKKIGIHAST